MNTTEEQTMRTVTFTVTLDEQAPNPLAPWLVTTSNGADWHVESENVGKITGDKYVENHPYELTYAEFAETPEGAELWFTNWPGRASVPVNVLPHDDEDGNVQFASGRKTFAMADELTWVPRAGLEKHAR
jgi:hypothetical protein